MELNKITIKNKKGFLVRTWLMAFLLFSSIFALMFMAANDLANDYDSSAIIDAEYREKYDVFDETVEGQDGDKSLRDIFTELRTKKGLELFGTAAVGIFKIFATLIRTVFGSILILGDVMENIAEDLGVPEGIANVLFELIIMLISVVLIFAVVSSINKGNKL